MADINAKTLQTRIALKYDSYANWTDETKEGLGANLVLLKGELGICAIEDKAQGAQTAPTVLFKVGDGTSPFKSLKWASALAADVYSWAKASDVRLSGKTIEFVGGKDADGKDIIVKSIPLNYATPEEVESKVATERARIAALEEKFTGENSVQGQIEALGGRLDAIEGDAGTIATGDAATLAAAKTYAEGEADAAEAAAKAYAKEYADGLAITQDARDDDQDALITANADAISKEASDRATAVTNAISAAAEDATTKAGNAETAAKAYTDERETEINKAIAAAEAAAKKDAADNLATAVSTQAAADAAQNTEIDKKLDKATYEAYIAGKSMSDAELKGYADSVASTAKSEAKTETQNQISALVTTGQVNTNTEAIAQNKADIAAIDAAYKKAVADEAKARDDADKDLDTRLDKVEAFFEGAAEDSEGLNDALDKLVDIQNYLNGEGSGADGLMGQVATNARDIANLQKEFTSENGQDGRVVAAEKAIEAVEADLSDYKTTITGALAGKQDVIPADTYDAHGAAAAVKTYVDGNFKTAVEGYADGKASAAESNAKNYADGLKTALAAEDAALKEAINKKLDEATHIEGHAGTADEITAEISAAVKNEKDRAELAELAINNKIGTIAADKTVSGLVSDAQKDATQALADAAAVAGRMTTAEGEIDVLQEASHAHANKGELDKIVDGDKAKWDDAYSKRHTHANKDELDLIASGDKNKWDTAATNAANAQSRVAAIEADYLMAADFFIIDCGSSKLRDGEPVAPPPAPAPAN